MNTGRWAYHITTRSSEVTATQLRRYANRRAQPDLATLALADNIESDNLVHLYNTNPEWADRLNAAAAAWAQLSILRHFNINSSDIDITAQYITEQDTNIS